MKKCLFLLALTLTLAACDKDEYDVTIAGNGYNYVKVNDRIKEGQIVDNLLFYGTSNTTAPGTGDIFTDKKGYFELTTGDSDNATVLYMHGVRFAAAMPGMEMRILKNPYTGSGKNISIEVAGPVTPQSQTAANTWEDGARYQITNLSVEIEDLQAHISFTCMGFQVDYTGRMIE